MDFNYANYMLTDGGRKGKENQAEVCSPRREAYRKRLAKALNMTRSRILAFKNKPAIVVDPFPKDFFSSYVHQPRPAKPRRCIPHSFEKTLDAHNIHDNFYLNLLDWGCSNVLTVAFSNTVYLYDCSHRFGSPHLELVTVDDEENHVTSVCWLLMGGL
ncbi:hypothetical protein Q3G72_009758 [Acer saccharum]|nr:hypothetical protein Q3G72_009758 [Acer saccharum]